MWLHYLGTNFLPLNIFGLFLGTFHTKPRLLWDKQTPSDWNTSLSQPIWQNVFSATCLTVLCYMSDSDSSSLLHVWQWFVCVTSCSLQQRNSTVQTLWWYFRRYEIHLSLSLFRHWTEEITYGLNFGKCGIPTNRPQIPVYVIYEFYLDLCSIKLLYAALHLCWRLF